MNDPAIHEAFGRIAKDTAFIVGHLELSPGEKTYLLSALRSVISSLIAMPPAAQAQAGPVAFADAEPVALRQYRVRSSPFDDPESRYHGVRRG